ncbi:MAG: TonB-dependent receptor, partial [Bacteroidota bacterium]
GLTDRGNIRNLFPLNFDERHRFNATLDYRYGSGSKYNGPRWFGKDIFANAGVTLIALAVSGRPYTAKIQPTVLGGAGTVGAINGARKPWQYRLDLRADKDFDIVSAASGRRPLTLNVYLRVQNLLDTRNIVNVYPATGSATDDGYLRSPNGQEALNTIDQTGRDVNAYIDAYSWRLLNPGLYTLPRRIILGARFGF